MDRSERRRHVRMKPIPELPASAARVGEGLVHEAVEVVDVSVGGLALATRGSLERATVGDRMKLRLSLARHGDHALDVEVRWAAGGATGVSLSDPPPAVTQALSRYVAELLERGAPS